MNTTYTVKHIQKGLTLFIETGDQGLKNVAVIKTNCKEDETFADVLDGMVGTEATYSVLRHSCRTFSQMMFEDAKNLFSGGVLPGATEDCPCPAK